MDRRKTNALSEEGSFINAPDKGLPKRPKRIIKTVLPSSKEEPSPKFRKGAYDQQLQVINQPKTHLRDSTKATTKKECHQWLGKNQSKRSKHLNRNTEVEKDGDPI